MGQSLDRVPKTRGSPNGLYTLSAGQGGVPLPGGSSSDTTSLASNQHVYLIPSLGQSDQRFLFSLRRLSFFVPLLGFPMRVL